LRFSLSEIETMSMRAARGAGLPWGLAEEAGKAARWLTVRGLFSAERLAGILGRHDRHNHADLAPTDLDGVWQATSGGLCPLIAGTALCDIAADIADSRTIKLGETREPLWLAPYVAGAAKLTGAVISIAWDDVIVTLSDKGEGIEGNESALTASRTSGVRCQHASQLNAPTALTQESARIPAVPTTAWSRLEALAQRTYAPSTEASRLSGAGAGLTDNN